MFSDFPDDPPPPLASSPFCFTALENLENCSCDDDTLINLRSGSRGVLFDVEEPLSGDEGSLAKDLLQSALNATSVAPFYATASIRFSSLCACRNIPLSLLAPCVSPFGASASTEQEQCYPSKLEGVAKYWPSRYWDEKFLATIGERNHLVVSSRGEPNTDAETFASGAVLAQQTNFANLFSNDTRAISGESEMIEGTPKREGNSGDLREDMELFEQVPQLRKHFHWPMLFPPPLATSFVEYFWTSPGGSSTPLHLDIAAGRIGHVVLKGEKTFLMWHYTWDPLLDLDMERMRDGALYLTDQEAAEVKRRVEPLRYTLRPHDALYIPWGWWHTVEYGPSRCIAVNVMALRQNVRQWAFLAAIGMAMIARSIGAMARGDFAPAAEALDIARGFMTSIFAPGES